MIPALTTLALLLAAGAPDVIPSGLKVIALELRIEVGDGVRGLCFAHRVEKGDTLGEIATVYLGKPSRWKEIAALNPDVDPTTMRPGQVLWIPPRDGLLPGELPRFVYMDTMAPFSSHPMPFTRNALPGRTPRGHVVLLLVPATERTEVERLRGEDPRGQATTRLVDAGRIERIRCEARGNLVQDDDPTARRIDTYRIDREKETGTLSVALVGSEAFDADGQRLDSNAADGPDERKNEALLFVVLAAGGMAGIVVLRRRRLGPVLRTA